MSKVDALHEKRFKGAFYTPHQHVELATQYLDHYLEPDWREEYIVWDCAWGQGALTENLKAKNLYCSTLDQCDLDYADENGINPDATKFQMDFLNDGDDKLPPELLEVINSGKKILFFINPPYAGAGIRETRGGRSKTGVANNRIGSEMKADKWGKSSRNLYSQFMYRIFNYQKVNKNVKIGIFCQPLYLSGPSFEVFRKNFLSEFGYRDGFYFPAAHFEGLSKEWGINFALFLNKPNENKHNFVHMVYDFDDKKELLLPLGFKNIYNLDVEMKASEWVRLEVKGKKTYDAPQISSYVKVKDPWGGEPHDGQKMHGMLTEDAVGYFCNHSNNVGKNALSVGMFSGAFSVGDGLSITEENIDKCNALFTARKAHDGRGALTEDAVGYFYNHSNNVGKNALSVGMFRGAFSNGHGLSITEENIDKCNALFTARKAHDGQKMHGMLTEDAVGYFLNHGNNVSENAQNVGLFSGAYSSGNGLSVTEENIDKCNALFTARKAHDGGKGRLTEDAVGYFCNNSNNVSKNAQSVGLFSGAFSVGEGLSATEENIDKCNALFTARKTTPGTWGGDKDEYKAPNETHQGWPEYVLDSTVFSLFHTGSQQSSLRNVSYKGKKYDIKNEFFWIPKKYMVKWAKKFNFQELIDDMEGHNERLMVRKIKGQKMIKKFSPEALAVLTLAVKLVYKTMRYRKRMHIENPKLHLQAWDAGFAQIRQIAKKYRPELLEEFKIAFDKLKEKVQPMIYELEFLK